jgi:hypothetical protein
MNDYRNDLLKRVGIEKLESELGVFDWIYISKEINLSDDFIVAFKENLNWTSISIHRKLSEDFIRKYQHLLNWHIISRDQKLSDDFLIEFEDKIVWPYYFLNDKPSFLILKKYILKVNNECSASVPLEHLNDFEQQEVKRIINLKQLFTI